MTTRASLFVAVVALLGVSRPIIGQTGTATRHPSFAGTWIPDNQNRSNTFFAARVTDVPGDGKLIIEQTAVRLTVRVEMSDEEQDRLGRAAPFATSVIFHIDEAGRSGGVGAGGPLPLRPGVATWSGDQIVIPNPGPGRIYRMTYSLAGEHLKRDILIGPTPDRASTVTELFSRAK